MPQGTVTSLQGARQHKMRNRPAADSRANPSARRAATAGRIQHAASFLRAQQDTQRDIDRHAFVVQENRGIAGACLILQRDALLDQCGRDEIAPHELGLRRTRTTAPMLPCIAAHIAVQSLFHL